MKNYLLLFNFLAILLIASCTSPSESLEGVWKIRISQEPKDPKELTLTINHVDGEDFTGYLEGGKHYLKKRSVSGSCIKYSYANLYRVYFREEAGSDYAFDFGKKVKKGKVYEGKTDWYNVNFYMTKID
jgi:hypothetical protein